jgi:pimeloyl-ACP methyl ester carboxylesterase
VFEFLEAIGPLSDPASYGGSPEDAFDVVVPSLPGYGFSSKPKGKPIGPATTAALWNQLMTGVLGYPKFGAQGGDLANGINTQLGRSFVNSLIGLHYNGIAAAPALPAESEQTPEEKTFVRALTAYQAAELPYLNEHRTKPQTVALALTDSPVGAAAWIVEKLKIWSDSPDQFEPVFTKDQALTNIMIYLVTNSIGTATWFYRGNADDGGVRSGKITVPTAFASSPHEMTILNPPESVVARTFNLVQYTKMAHGGHFAFWEQPQAMVADVRQFFRKLRT